MSLSCGFCLRSLVYGISQNTKYGIKVITFPWESNSGLLRERTDHCLYTPVNVRRCGWCPKGLAVSFDNGFESQTRPYHDLQLSAPYPCSEFHQSRQAFQTPNHIFISKCKQSKTLDMRYLWITKTFQNSIWRLFRRRQRHRGTDCACRDVDVVTTFSLL